MKEGMKVLLVHNDYGKYSGEEAVVDGMAAMLSEIGCEVSQLRMTTAGIRDSLGGKIHAFASGIYCPSGVRAMRQALERFRPDVVNVHNLYPFISPAALRECRRAGVPVVMTVHNFRLICPTGLFMRNGAPCELCLQRGDEWGCIRHNCENSILKSTGYALRNAVARLNRYYLDCVDRFACITRFQRDKLVAAGFPAERIEVIPNSVDVGQRQPDICSRGDYVAYCGRISSEKGVDMIIETARRHPDIPFRLAGEVRNRELTDNLPANVELCGYLSGEALENFYRGARFAVMASRCYEGFPMSILEAARYARPVIAPGHGGFTEIISHGEDASGMLFHPGDTDELDNAVATLWNDGKLCTQLGDKAYRKLRDRYATDVIRDKWAELLLNVTKS